MKPPAFQFYADDFIGGTVCMSAEDCGAYVRLLCYQWSHGSIPQDQVIIDRIAGCKVSSTVVAKFPNGVNARLEAERAKQAAWRAKCSLGGRKSSELRKGSSRVVEQPLQVNGQLNSNTPPSTLHSPLSTLHTPVDSSRFAPPSEEESKLHAAKIGMPEIERQKFMAHYESNGWMVSGKKMKVWRAAMTKWKLTWETNRYGTNKNNRNEGIVGHNPAEEPRAVRILRQRAEAEAREKAAAQNAVATQVDGHGSEPPGHPSLL